MNRTLKSNLGGGSVRRPGRTDVKGWVVLLARLGYAAKGVVYMIVGVLAVQAAWGGGGRTTGSEGALHTIVRQPFGQAMLWIVGIGLIGYALWRVIQGALDPENKGTDAKGLVTRGAYIVSGIVHGALAFSAFGLATGGGGGGGGGTKTMTAEVMSNPFGALLIGLAGVAVIGYAVRAVHKAYSGKYREQMALGELDHRTRTWVDRAGRWGLYARAVVFGMIGTFLIVAAVQHDPQEARGLDGTLDTLASQPYGPWLLGLVAIGLVAYGVYSIVKARYRRFAA